MKKTIEYRAMVDGVAISYWRSCGKKLLIFCPGLPQYVSSYHPFLQTLLDLGYDVLVPKYRGTYESNGEFSFAESIASIQAVLGAVESNTLVELYGMTPLIVPNSDVVLLGFSYGGFVARFVESKGLVRKKVLLMPFVDVRAHGKEVLKQEFLFLERAYPQVYRFAPHAFLNELEQVESGNHTEPFILVSGALDNVITQAELALLQADKVLILEAKHTPNLSTEQYTQILL